MTVIVITGCTFGGIGYFLAQEFRKRPGYIVIATARNPHKIFQEGGDEQVKPLNIGPMGANIYTCALDVTDESSMKSAIDLIISKFSKIDVLINNAGASVGGPILEISMDRVKDMYAVNVFGVVRLSQLVFPHMAARKSGRIVNIGSIAGDVTTPWGGSYSSSKAAIRLITDAMRMECKPFGIQVMLVKPGAIKSNIGQQNLKSLGESNSWKWYAPYDKFIRIRAVSSQGDHSTPTDEFARAVVDVLEKSTSSLPTYFAYGTYTWIFFWLRTLIPTFVADLYFNWKFGLSSSHQ